jgi:predicted transcriptional regulator
LESNTYHNEEIEESDYREMLMNFEKKKPFTKSEIGKIEDFISKWEKVNNFDLYFAHHSPRGLFKKSKYGLNVLNYHNYPLELQVIKDDDDWFYISSTENTMLYTAEWEMKYYKCDSIDGLIDKLNEILSRLFITQSEKDLRKVISNKIKNLPSDKLSKLEKILDTL